MFWTQFGKRKGLFWRNNPKEIRFWGKGTFRGFHRGYWGLIQFLTDLAAVKIYGEKGKGHVWEKNKGFSQVYGTITGLGKGGSYRGKCRQNHPFGGEPPLGVQFGRLIYPRGGGRRLFSTERCPRHSVQGSPGEDFLSSDGRGGVPPRGIKCPAAPRWGRSQPYPTQESPTRHT